MENAFDGTIYEAFYFPGTCSHDLVVHANPDVAHSPALQGKQLPRGEMERLAAQAAQLFRECLSGPEEVLQLPVEGFLILVLGYELPREFDGPQEDALMSRLEGNLSKAIAMVRERLEIALQLSVSALHPNTHNVYDAYHEAFSIALHFPFFQHSGQIILFHGFQHGLSTTAVQEKQQLEKQWAAQMEARNYRDAEQLLMQILRIRASAPITVTTLTQELMCRLEFYTYQLCDTMTLPVGAQDALLRRIELIRSVKNMEELCAQAHQIYEGLSTVISSGNGQSDQTWARKISLYIQNNYADPDLNAALISQRFGLAPAYISHIFHKSTGIKLLDYIHSTRIARIKQLLRNTDLSLTEIALQTGYIDRYSMSRVFSRYVGMPPSDYRRS
jgi:YesN/AraC family two-component response regulator